MKGRLVFVYLIVGFGFALLSRDILWLLGELMHWLAKIPDLIFTLWDYVPEDIKSSSWDITQDAWRTTVAVLNPGNLLLTFAVLLVAPCLIARALVRPNCTEGGKVPIYFSAVAFGFLVLFRVRGYAGEADAEIIKQLCLSFCFVWASILVALPICRATRVLDVVNNAVSFLVNPFW
jgi:hypothetical protein